jgi:hypothetical protein
VEGIDDCPLLLDFEVVVLEVSTYLIFHSYAVWIKQDERTVVVEVLYREGHHDLEKFWMECIPSGNLRRRIRQTWNWKTIWEFGNYQVHYCTFLHNALEIEFTAITSLRQYSTSKCF